MRGTFFAYLGFALVGLIIAYFVFLVVKSFWTLFSDARTNRELDQLAQEYTERRKARRASESERLNNGCEHVYGHPLSALPDDACCKCGLMKDRPLGNCDHVWRVTSDVVPSSRCERCGETYARSGHAANAGTEPLAAPDPSREAP